MHAKKLNLIYRLRSHELGSGLHALNLARSYPDLFDAVDFSRQKVPGDCRLWILHNPFFYREQSVLSRASDYICTRVEFCKMMPGKHLTNGFSYFKRSRELYHGWFPTIYASEFTSKPSETCIGYYARDIREESNLAFAEFASHLPRGISILTSGTREVIERHFHGDPSWQHTYDMKQFWTRCSHYFYFRPASFQDPMPHTLLEAAQAGCRVISPKNPKRNFEDGIDDLLSVIQDYDETLVEDRNAPKCRILSDTSRWHNLLEQLVQNDFKLEHRSRISYRRQSFIDWIEKNL